MDDSSSRQHVLQACRDHDVKFIRLWFTDILGMLKSVAITVEELEHALADGISFDGSSIRGFARAEETDMLAVPDAATFQLLPWRPREQAVARMFCDIREPSGEPFAGDPRAVLQRTLARAAAAGFTFYVSPEIEFFYFRDSDGTEPLDAGGYFDLTAFDAASDLRRETVLMLEELGIGVALSHHEVAPSQHEMDLEVAQRHGVYATFMPKPMTEHNGSGMHLQLSLFRGERNAFYDADADLRLAPLARQFAAGLLRHAPETLLVTNQWVNSYKRLVPGSEAPTHQSWSPRNQAELVRVPEHRPGQELSTRVEYRAPDAACNPYLALASVLAAGMAGVDGGYELPPAAGEGGDAPGALPSTLGEAIEGFAASTLMRETLGDHVFETLITNKREEWARYRVQVSEYERTRYLPLL
jgi:glutamine synthetase